MVINVLVPLLIPFTTDLENGRIEFSDICFVIDVIIGAKIHKVKRSFIEFSLFDNFSLCSVIINHTVGRRERASGFFGEMIDNVSTLILMLSTGNTETFLG